MNAGRFVIETLVGFRIGIQGRSVKRNAGEESLGPGVSQNISSTRAARGPARSSRRSHIAANLRLALHDSFHCLRRHEQKNVIGGRTANLKTSTGASNGVDGGR